MKIFGEKNETDLQLEDTVTSMDDTMEVQGDRTIDVLQAVLYNSGSGLLHRLEEEIGVVQDQQAAFQDAWNAFRELKTFHYNIGFAGEQSSGKSTVINSLIEYPLMSTCNLTTTCVSTKLIYGENIRILIHDDDNTQKVLDIDCGKLTKQHIRLLKEYACAVMSVSIIENLQYFTDKDIFKDRNVKPDDLIYFDDSNPKHIAVLVLILLTVYVGQNNTKLNHNEKKANEKRREILNIFGFPTGVVNYSVQVSWDHEMLKSGLIITDLPGLGAMA